MGNNTYDDPDFFSRYSGMPRSVKGLEAAGEWHVFRRHLPPLAGKRVLDLGCGFGWHCRYAAEQGAAEVVGVDVSENMLSQARRTTVSPVVRYIRAAIEDVRLPPRSFDVAISSLAFHYVASFASVAAQVRDWLVPGGDFVFSAEHPVFTAQGPQEWHRDTDGAPLH